MKSLATSLILLTIACSTLALGLKPFTWTTHHHHQTQDPRVVEIVRWRQPVCLQPAPGVSSCMLDLRRVQAEYEQTRGKGGAETKEGYSVFTESIESSSEEEQEKDEIIKKLVYPELATTLSLEYLQSSQPEEFMTEKMSESGQRTTVLTEEQERNVRDRKYLIPPVERLINPRQQIYVTKVVDSPVTATLVAYNCLPDIGVPLCETRQNVIKPSAPSYAWRPTLTIGVSQDTHKKRPTGVWQVIKESLQSEPYLGSVREAVDHSGPEIVVQQSKNDQSSMKFDRDEQRIEEQPVGLERVKIPNEDRSGLFYVIGDTGVSNGNRLPAKVNHFDGTKIKQTEVSGQSSQQEINVEFIRDAGNVKEDSKLVAETTTENTLTTKQGNSILQAIHGFVEQSENSDIVKRIQNFLHGSESDGDRLEVSSVKETGVAGFLSKFRPANFFHREQTDVKGGSGDSGVEVSTKVPSKVSVDVEPEILEDTKLGFRESVQPDISVGVKPKIVTDFNAILPSNVDSVVSENVGQKISVEVNQELDGTVQPEIPARLKPEIAADIKELLSENGKSVISEDVKPEISMQVNQELVGIVQPEIPASLTPEIAADIKELLSENGKSVISAEVRPEFFDKMLPKIPANLNSKVAADSSTNVKSYFSAVVKSAIPTGIRTESLTDVKPEISTHTKLDISTAINPKISASTMEQETKIPLNANTALPVRTIVQVSDEIIDEKSVEPTKIAIKETGTITKVLDQSQIDPSNVSGILDTVEKTQDIVYGKPSVKPIKNQSILAGLLPNPVKLLKNENEK